MNKNYTKLKEIFYDHWKMVFPYIVPFLGVILLSFWKDFRNIMLQNVPFWILLVFLILIGCLITIILFQLKKIKDISKKFTPSVVDTVLINNLVYKKDDTTQAHCPYCFEKEKGLKRMGRVFDNDCGIFSYYCFICDHREEVPFSEEKNTEKSV